MQHDTQSETVKAYLTQSISYNKDGVEVNIPKNTLIMVDETNGVALVQDDHVVIEKDEYQVLLP